MQVAKRIYDQSAQAIRHMEKFTKYIALFYWPSRIEDVLGEVFKNISFTLY